MMVDKVKHFFKNQPFEDCKILKQISHKISRLSDYQSLNTRKRKQCLSFAFTATEFSSDNECFGIVCCWDVLFPVCGLFSEFYSRRIFPSSLIVQELRHMFRDCHCPWCWNPQSPKHGFSYILRSANSIIKESTQLKQYIKQGIKPEKGVHIMELLELLSIAQ